jgi:DNA topoisomerase VI subunit B
MSSGTFYIRPAGRHMSTIGEGLIKDQYAALVELVKNAYDADATKVEIIFDGIKNEFGKYEGITIEVVDDGHGMSYKTVTSVWMTPSTSDKLQRKNSPNGRSLQGRKGIGRYAVSMLGDELILETVDEDHVQTIAYINWRDFDQAEYLQDVPIEIESNESQGNPGTKILTLLSRVRGMAGKR